MNNTLKKFRQVDEVIVIHTQNWEGSDLKDRRY